jgi:Protein of unknown function (DUF3043)
MLGRRTTTPDAPAAADLQASDEPVGKGRPTPKRADARKARRNATPKNRREAAAMQRDRRRVDRQTARQALLSGDERHLPARDAGPEKRLARDVVDSRFTYGQIFFGLIIAVVVLSLTPSVTVKAFANFVALFSLMMMGVDGFRNGRRAKAAVTARYGADNARGVSSYAFMRSLLPRRFRRPPPRVKRGEQVR